MQRDSVLKKIEDDIAAYGWHCLSVRDSINDPEPDFVPFSYTIGLTTTFDHPELIIFGLDTNIAHGILSACASQVREFGPLPENRRIPDILERSLDVVVRPMNSSHFAEYIGTALRYFDSSRVLVSIVFWPDVNNVFAWEPGYEMKSLESLIHLI